MSYHTELTNELYSQFNKSALKEIANAAKHFASILQENKSFVSMTDAERTDLDNLQMLMVYCNRVITRP